MRKVGIIVAAAALTFALCAAQRPERPTNAAGQPTRFTQVKMQGVASAIEPRTSPDPLRPVHHARGAFTRSVPASPAPAPIQHTRAPSPPIHSGGLHGLVCSYGWSCAIATCVVNRETGGTWNPHAYNPSGAAGLFQLMPHWYHEKWQFDPFNPYENVRYAHLLYVLSGGWHDPWRGDGPACGF